MKKSLKFILIIITIIVSLSIIDLICIFTINRPLFAVKGNVPNMYSGLFYDTYNCNEDAIPLIKAKWTKFACLDESITDKKIIEIVDKTKEMDNFACAEMLEQFYEDDKYTYYYSCMKNQYIVVKYTDGTEVTVSDALKKNMINISDLDNYNITYYKYEK